MKLHKSKKINQNNLKNCPQKYLIVAVKVNKN